MNEMHDSVLIEALDLLESGASIDSIVARFPERAAELRPFLLTAAALGQLAAQPTLTAQAQSKRTFLAAAEQMATAQTRPASAGWWRRLLAPALALLLVVFLGGAGLAAASGTATPGDALYGTKRFIEQTRLSLTGDPERAAALREQFRQERVREVERLLAEGRRAAVSLTGPIEAIRDDGWVVAGVPVAITAGTVVDGWPAVGAVAQVEGQTGEGVVVAERVIVLVGGPLPEPTPLPVDEGGEDMENDDGEDDPAVVPGLPPATTATPSPTATATASPAATTPPTALPTAEPSATPPPTAAPPPTATPDDDDDDDNGGDDNANDNGGDDNANDNGDDDDANDNGGDDNADDNGDDNANDNGDDGGDDDSANDNADDGGGDGSSGPGGGDDGANDNGDDEDANDNDDDAGSGSGGDDDDNGDD